MGWSRAVEIDNALRPEGLAASQETEKNRYLHRSCLPLDVHEFDRTHTLFHPSARGSRPGGVSVEVETIPSTR